MALRSSGTDAQFLRNLQKQVSNEIYREYTYFFSSDVFEKYILKFMTHHLEQWKNKEVFYGGDIVLEFYNEVIRLREHRNFHF